MPTTTERLTERELLRDRVLISLRDAARVLGLAESTVRNQLARGTLCVPTIKVGRLRRIRVADVIAFLEGALPPPPRRPRGRPRKTEQLRRQATAAAASGCWDSRARS